MAMRWLDLARYADTSGYQNDGPRYMWRWRDWVIDAYNNNMPFDQFTIHQLAGDLMQEFLALLALECRPQLSQLPTHLRNCNPQLTDFVFGAPGNFGFKIALGNSMDLLLQARQAANQAACYQQGHRRQRRKLES